METVLEASQPQPAEGEKLTQTQAADVQPAIPMGLTSPSPEPLRTEPLQQLPTPVQEPAALLDASVAQEAATAIPAQVTEPTLEPTLMPTVAPTTLEPTLNPAPVTPMPQQPTIATQTNSERDEADPTATPVPTVTCLEGPGTFEICVTARTARPTPKYPALERLSIPVQNIEDRLWEARERGESTVDIPNVFITVIMEQDESIQPVVDYLEDNDIPHARTLKIGNADGIFAGTVAIYDIHWGSEYTRANLFAVIPATMVLPIHRMDGIKWMLDGMETYEGLSTPR